MDGQQKEHQILPKFQDMICWTINYIPYILPFYIWVFYFCIDLLVKINRVSINHDHRTLKRWHTCFFTTVIFNTLKWYQQKRMVDQIFLRWNLIKTWVMPFCQLNCYVSRETSRVQLKQLSENPSQGNLMFSIA